MKLRFHIFKVRLILILALAVALAGCSTTRSADNAQNGMPPIIPSGTEVVQGNELDQVLGSELSENSRPELPLNIEVIPKEDQTRLGPFYSLLPELAWSPDGRYLAIFGEKNGYGLWLWDRHTKATRRLVQLLDRSGERLTSLTFFGWSQDGHSLFYAVDGIQSEGQLLGKNGVLVRQLGLDGQERAVAWLPGEGAFIRSWLFNPQNNRLLLHRGQDLWMVDTAQRRSKKVKSNLPVWDGLFWVALSPTGEKAVYPEPESDKHRLIIVDINTGRETLVGNVNEYSFYPVWSPNGEKLAFLSASFGGQGYDFQIGEDGPLPPATKILVVTKEGQLLAEHIPQNQEKAGAPVWSADSRQLAFLSAAVSSTKDGFSEVKWRRLLLATSAHELQDWGSVSGDWITIGGFTPDNKAVLLYIYEAGGGVTAVLQGPTKRAATLAQGAVDEQPIWWHGYLILPHLAENSGDYLDTQLYLHDLKHGSRLLTSGPGWKSGVQVSDRYMAYTSADNQKYPYPLTVVIQPLPG
ncbi:MAG: hypothetical protein GX489_01750 [Firmicutes bacterium]|nr:hypothetical protein [Bacillota bacterium]